MPEIGPEIAATVRGWFDEEENLALIEKLRAAGVRLADERTAEDAPRPFEGMSIVLTGGLETLTREEATARAQAAGARVASSVSKKTAFVVAGEGPGTKLAKAESLGVDVDRRGRVRPPARGGVVKVYRVRSIDSLGRALAIMLGLTGAFNLVNGLTNLAYWRSNRFVLPLGEESVFISTDPQGAFPQAVSTIGGFVAIATIVVWMIWQHHATANLWARGFQSLQITPGWSVGWWFVPFANLVMPYVAVREVDRRSRTDGQFRTDTGPVGWWWAAFLVSVVPAVRLLLLRVRLADRPVRRRRADLGPLDRSDDPDAADRRRPGVRGRPVGGRGRARGSWWCSGSAPPGGRGPRSHAGPPGPRLVRTLSPAPGRRADVRGPCRCRPAEAPV